MITSEPALTATLRTHRLSLTVPRQKVFMALQKMQPLTMAELVRALPDIDRASIYRTIAIFEELHIVQRLQQGWKYKLELSDQFSPHHHHLTCRNCQRVISFDEPAGFDEIIRTIAAAQHFDAQEHVLEISGICQQCRATDQAAKTT